MSVIPTIDRSSGTRRKASKRASPSDPPFPHKTGVPSHPALDHLADPPYGTPMRFLLTSLTAAMTLGLATPAQAWGPIGHRVTGAIADRNLSGVARANVRLLLGEDDLAEAATWPDDMKSDPADFWQKTASPWHYVTVKEGDVYKGSDAPPQGDAMTALTRFTATLRDPKAPVEDRRPCASSSTSSATCISRSTQAAAMIGAATTSGSHGSAEPPTSIQSGIQP